jgi:Fe-S cluster biogenesis protein NfuA
LTLTILLKISNFLLYIEYNCYRDCQTIKEWVNFTEEIIMLEEKIKNALEDVRPSLQADGGDVEFISLAEDGTVSLKLTGACGGCPMAQMTLKMGIESYLKKEVPEVTAVVGV